MITAYAEPNPLSMIPFGARLLALAIAPSLPGKQWHRHHGKICATFAALTIFYYIFGLRDGSRVLHAGFEYGSFIVVVAGFFVVAGTIHLRVPGRGTPALNTLFLFAGALLGNLLGTVGASMLLIRPWIALNRERFAGFHITFFIIVVSNIGGVLLPIGPPLLRGYLKGVPFLWTAQRCWLPWIVTLGVLLIVFYLFDHLNFRRAKLETPAGEKWECAGAANFLAIGAMLACRSSRRPVGANSSSPPSRPPPIGLTRPKSGSGTNSVSRR
jgi:Na+/H+ antiporter NhaD/arsenite permease-like protein